MGEAATAVKPSFSLPNIVPNETGWGPLELPGVYKDLPFQFFNKGDRIGKIADWTGTLYTDKRFGTRYAQQYATGQLGSQYAYVHEEEEIGFQLVDTSRAQKTAQQKANMMRHMHLQRKLMQKEREKQRQQGAAGGFIPPRGSKAMEKDRQKQYKRWQKQFGQRQRYDQRGQVQIKLRAPSFQVKPDWEVLEEIDFQRLHRLNLPGIGEGEDIAKYGSMEYYDRNYDRCSTKNDKPLQRVQRMAYNVTTTDDPVIEKLAKKPEYRVFATDTILAALMCCTRSVYSWDIIVHRVGNKLFFDKRDKSDFDLLTVSETAQEPPQEEGMNSPKTLAVEATFINRNFSQQVLKMNEERYNFDNSNPFIEEGINLGEVASVGYRYRKWDLGNGIVLVARCEHDGVMPGPNGEAQFLTIKAFNEWDSSYSGGIDWRTKIDTQRGAVLATELRNNSCKLAKWTVQAILSGSDQIKFGYVSRVHVRDSTKHVILGTQQFKPTELASQITLSMENAWGILRVIVDLCLQLNNGKYVIMKDPNKPIIRLYRLPAEAESEESDESDEENTEEKEK